MKTEIGSSFIPATPRIKPIKAKEITKPIVVPISIILICLITSNAKPPVIAPKTTPSNRFLVLNVKPSKFIPVD